MTDPRRTATSAGFTLIELLVVISIISLLIALLLPALRGAREQTLITQCSSNLRQYSVVLYSYQEEWDRLPVGYAVQSSSGRASLRYWPREVYDQYLTLSPDPKIYECPTKLASGFFNNSYGNVFLTSYLTVTGKHPVTWHGSVPDGPPMHSGARTDDNDPFEQVLAADVLEYNNGYIFNHENLGYMGSNVVYADGHVTWHTWEHGLDVAITNVSQDYRGGNDKFWYFGDGTP